MDLPDELICFIWNKLDNIDVFYSFSGVNKRFDKLLRDPMYIRTVQLTSKNKFGPLSDLIVDQYCCSILPAISQSIECLIVEPFTMERVLRSGLYLRLRKLIFTKISQKFASQHFTGNARLLFIHCSK